MGCCGPGREGTRFVAGARGPESPPLDGGIQGSDMDRQRRRQAEFLVHGTCPWRLTSGIGVYNEAARGPVEASLTRVGLECSVPVAVRGEWYFKDFP